MKKKIQMGFYWGNLSDANVQVGQQKYVITAGLYWKHMLMSSV